jgi:beta-fructofuranosidase
MYAPKSVAHPRGGRLLWGWMRETRPQAAQLRAGWSGVMSLPLDVSVGQDGRVRLQPRAECAQLRRGGGVQSPAGLPGDAVEFVFDLDATRDAALLRGGRLWFAWSAAEGRIDLGGTRAALPLRSGKVRLFFDGSLGEMFVDGHYVAGRSYGHGGGWQWREAPKNWRAFPLAL